ncbi:PAS domain-containing protein [Polynucleobacter sphagniphilus]|jgi:PAS domain S-box-containing protein|uniref:PAS domain S-box-containing protein n=1 Tax=Polynucleobacter sphagniphilus TaxID=1743169 RepID=A0AA43S5V5_9BURK|nr:PAS domain-containing protein [Polynucleobacter sphagniphilus]MDF9787110.1 PAS domain S-box-containing protein [Polynucleobacter sphagniphilus]MDH6155822.1 PAS domain S-box-containing protein [Polynucleobacter sphagniphilus]MDH6249741.1 PAS domain S-box-containing protein [Polynucleobacter sphagniphilus]MDH6300497.1 PAS domain S-box-containing protein [Polynucleobacter sphagniphilus]MDH6303219.1 PAS domain S-box-containing protein [Polynucleobacter sphagniphilus]
MSTNINFEVLVRSIGDGVVISDAKGVIIYWNPAAERIFGFTESEALGKTLDLIIPERLRARHNEGYDHSMETGTTRYGDKLLTVPALHKSGSPLSIAFTVSMIFDEHSKASAVAAIIRDDTARFTEERALHKRIMELESAIK